MTREDVTNALFNQLIAGGQFATIGRRLLLWNKVAAQPALFLRNSGENWERRATGLPAKLVMDFEVWLYSNAGADPDAAPSIGLNELLAVVGAALDPFPLPAQTLGKLVTHCWIEGHVDFHPGDLDGQAIAVVPVHVLVPTFGG